MVGSAVNASHTTMPAQERVNERGFNPKITAVILAGGRGTRMGNVEKGLLQWQGRPLIAHLIDALAPQVDTILINANREHQRYAIFGLPIIRDVAEFAGTGPLAGLHAALSHSQTEWVVCVPCDMPDLPSDLVARLLDAATAPPFAADVPANDVTQQPNRPPLAYVHHAGRAWPTLCLAHQTMLKPLTQSLKQGHYAAWRWFEEQGAGVARLDGAALKNINTLDELDAYNAEINV